MSSEGLLAASEVVGVERLSNLVHGTEGEVLGEIRGLEKLLGVATEVGGRVVVPCSVEPLTPSYALTAFAGCGGMALKRAEELPGVRDAALGLWKQIFHTESLMKRLPRDALFSAVGELVKWTQPLLPDPKAFTLLSGLAKRSAIGPAMLLDAFTSRALDEEACVQAAVFASHLIASHPIADTNDPKASGVPIAKVRTLLAAINTVKEDRAVRQIHEAVVAKLGREAGASALGVSLTGVPQLPLESIASSAAEFFGMKRRSLDESESTHEAEPSNPEELGLVTPSPITLQLILKGVMKATRKRGESLQTFLSNLTHLTLEGKGIGVLENLHCLPRLKVLYVSENQLRELGAGVAHLTALTHLYAQRNVLTSLRGVDNLTSLTKLYISNNSIDSLRGIEQLTHLHELIASDQEIGDQGMQLTTDDGDSVFTRLSHLSVLRLARVGLVDVQFQMVQAARGIEELDVAGNFIADPCGTLQSLPRLGSLAIKGNPVCTAPKYRDAIVMAAGKLKLLDGSEVSAREREFLRQLGKRKSSGVGQRKSSSSSTHRSGPGSGGATEKEKGGDRGAAALPPIVGTGTVFRTKSGGQLRRPGT